MERDAAMSECGQYRYRLGRQWGPGQYLLFVMLNPSTADEVVNDPTVERCERRARLWGYDGLVVTNLFALVSTDPKGLLAAADPMNWSPSGAIGAASGRASPDWRQR